MAIVTYNDNGTIKVVKFGTYVVSTDVTTTKQWVYVTYDSSEPTYQYHAYTNADATQEDCVDALEREFPARDLTVGTMGYVTVQGDDMYHILQVQEV